jgi:hypothetical protein
VLSQVPRRQFTGTIYCNKSSHNPATHFLAIQAEYRKATPTYGTGINGHNQWSVDLDELFGDVPDVVLFQDRDPQDVSFEDLFEDIERSEPPQFIKSVEDLPFDDPLEFYDESEGESEPQLGYGVENPLRESPQTSQFPPPVLQQVMNVILEPEAIPQHIPAQEAEEEDSQEVRTQSLEQEIKRLNGNSKQPRTLLIDASPIVHAAYHRLDALTAPGTSIPIHGIYGFMRKLLFYMKTYQYDYIALCLDSSKSFRKEVFPGYKANRSPQDAVRPFMFQFLYFILDYCFFDILW